MSTKGLIGVRLCCRIAMLVWGATWVALSGIAAPFNGDVIQFSIPPQPIDAALVAYAAQAGVQLIVSNNLLKGLRPSGVTGRYSREAALAVLLNGTGLQFKESGSDTITIVKKASTNN